MKDISELGEDAIIMFEEGGVGAEEVVSSDDYVTCVVDSSQMVSQFMHPMQRVVTPEITQITICRSVWLVPILRFV